MKQEENKIRMAITKYLTIKHPKLVFRWDLAADIRLTKGQAIRASKVQGRITKYPDLFIPDARAGYFGLYIELKKDRNEIFKKTGELRNSEHIQGQNNMLKYLRNKGYKAEFGIGFNHTVKLIDEYLGQKRTIPNN